MAKAYKITAENALEIREAMRDKGNEKNYMRLLAVALRGEGKSNAEAAEITQYHPKRVSQLVSKYCNHGLETLINDGRKGGNNRVMSEVEAEEFLNQFDEQAKNGQIVSVGDIAAAYDKATEKSRKSRSSAYYLLHRKNWRMVMPRGQHPKKAEEAEIEASKKLTNNTTS
jgi:transposase